MIIKYLWGWGFGGEFLGQSIHVKFKRYIQQDDVMLDFGCGGGYLLKFLDCKKKVGIEINPTAIAEALKMALRYSSRSTMFLQRMSM